MHTLIVGPRQVGKSTLIQKVIQEIGLPVWGFATKKEDALRDEELGSPIYIYDTEHPRIQTQQNLVGYCKDHHFQTNLENFNNFSKQMPTPPSKDLIILMDEIGFMESQAEDFCNWIRRYLDGDIPVIAAVKNKSTPFLDEVKSHPNCKCFYIQEENRDELCQIVSDFVKEQL